MKKFLVLLDNAFYTHNKDEWDSFRNEGRIPLNIGFGMSLLGYEVNIAYHSWDVEPKKTWNNIILSKLPIFDHYDVALSFATFNASSDLKFEKGLCIIYEGAHIDRAIAYEIATGKPLQWVTTLQTLSEPMSAHLKREVKYLPPLYPLPSINIGYLHPSYNPALPELKIYLCWTSWPQNTTISGDRFRDKEQLIINYLVNKGYMINLSILVQNNEDAVQCPIKNGGITTFHNSTECSYRSVLNLMQSADICITNGSPHFPGNGLSDIVSLGKPLIYVGDGRLGVEVMKNANLLYAGAPENIIYIQEFHQDSMRKIDKIMKDPAGLAKRYQEFYKDSDFNNWKEIVKGVL